MVGLFVEKSILCFSVYQYWYWVLVLGGPSNIGYSVLDSFLGIVLTLYSICLKLLVS